MSTICQLHNEEASKFHAVVVSRSLATKERIKATFSVQFLSRRGKNTLTYASCISQHFFTKL